MLSVFSKTLPAVLATATVAALTFPAQAGTLSGSSSSWHSPDPGEATGLALNVDPLSLGYNSVLWGNGLAKSGLGYKGFTDVDFELGKMFAVGKLIHLNTFDFGNNLLEEVKLDLTLDFDDPDFDAPVAFTLDIFNSPDSFNLFNLQLNPDVVDIDPNPIFNQVFTTDSGKYQLDIGFTKDPIVTDEPLSGDITSTSILKARVSKVPEPATISGLILVGVSLFGLRRYRHHEA